MDYKELRKELENCKRPLYFFHDDPDGLCSFLLIYKFIREGKGVIIKTHPNIDMKFFRVVEDYTPDKLFILDIAMVEQEFIDKVRTKLKIPIVWVDHHEPLERKNVKYFNSRIINSGKYVPVTAMCYEALKDVSNNYMWIAAVGILADYAMPDFIEDFRKKYPKLLGKNKKLDAIIYSSKMGDLIDIFSFVIKGKTEDAKKCIKIMTRIETPEEIMKEETPAAKFIFKRYKIVKEAYDQIYKQCYETAKKTEGELIVFKYQEDIMALSSEISNELIYNFPKKIVLIAREKSGVYRCSLRSKKLPLVQIVKKAIEGLEATGGGHEFACGATVKKEDFDEFVSRIEKAIHASKSS